MSRSNLKLVVVPIRQEDEELNAWLEEYRLKEARKAARRRWRRQLLRDVGIALAITLPIVFVFLMVWVRGK